MTQADSVHSTPPLNTSAETPLGGPEKPQDSLYFPTDTTPEQLFRAIGKLRKDARDEIDRLIRFLDETDNHMELEDSIDDNPQLDEGEDEPSLGSLSAMVDQSRWATAGEGGVDAEEEHDGREPEPREADLGSLDRVVDQRRTMLDSGLPWSVADGEVGAA